jgi:aryl-alcohol dehydrogenase-like predicted oxidoreductase
MKKPPLTAGRAVSPGFAPTASPEGSARDRSAEGARRAVFDFPPVDKEKAYDIIDAMKELGDARGVSVAQIALSWLLHQKHVTSVIIGAKTEAQLTDNLAATSVELSSDDLNRLDEVSKLKPEYPRWMLDRQRGERAQNLS